MIFIEILLIALAMSIDAFSVAFGIGCGKLSKSTGFRVALLFGIFQFIMPLLGAGLGAVLNEYFAGTKYIAALILFYIAYNMYKEAKNKDAECIPDLKLPKMLALAVATSLDAFGVGISIAVLPYNILYAATVIGVVCFMTSWIGFIVGGKTTKNFSKAEYFGAVVLVFIGIKTIIG